MKVSLNVSCSTLCILNETRQSSTTIPSSANIATGVEKLPIITSCDIGGRLHIVSVIAISIRMLLRRMLRSPPLLSRRKLVMFLRKMKAESPSVVFAGRKTEFSAGALVTGPFNTA